MVIFHFLLLYADTWYIYKISPPCIHKCQCRHQTYLGPWANQVRKVSAELMTATAKLEDNLLFECVPGASLYSKWLSLTAKCILSQWGVIRETERWADFSPSSCHDIQSYPDEGWGSALGAGLKLKLLSSWLHSINHAPLKCPGPLLGVSHVVRVSKRRFTRQLSKVFIYRWHLGRWLFFSLSFLLRLHVPSFIIYLFFLLFLSEVNKGHQEITVLVK